MIHKPGCASHHEGWACDCGTDQLDAALSGSHFQPGEASLRNLAGACIDMRNVILRAYTLLPPELGVDMSVIETRRTRNQQKKYIAQGVSWTIDSDHLKEDIDETGVLAGDIYPWIPGKGTSHDPEHYFVIANVMFHAAQIEQVPVLWGGFWSPRRRDYPHWAKRRSHD